MALPGVAQSRDAGPVRVLLYHFGRAGREGTDARAHGISSDLYDLLLSFSSWRCPWWSQMDRSKPEPERVTMDGGMPLWKSAAALGYHWRAGVPATESSGGRVGVRLRGRFPAMHSKPIPLISLLCSGEQRFMPAIVWGATHCSILGIIVSPATLAFPKICTKRTGVRP